MQSCWENRLPFGVPWRQFPVHAPSMQNDEAHLVEYQCGVHKWSAKLRLSTLWHFRSRISCCWVVGRHLWSLSKELRNGCYMRSAVENVTSRYGADRENTSQILSFVYVSLTGHQQAANRICISLSSSPKWKANTVDQKKTVSCFQQWLLVKKQFVSCVCISQQKENWHEESKEKLRSLHLLDRNQSCWKCEILRLRRRSVYETSINFHQSDAKIDFTKFWRYLSV